MSPVPLEGRCPSCQGSLTIEGVGVHLSRRELRRLTLECDHCHQVHPVHRCLAALRRQRRRAAIANLPGQLAAGVCAVLRMLPDEHNRGDPLPRPIVPLPDPGPPSPLEQLVREIRTLQDLIRPISLLARIILWGAALFVAGWFIVNWINSVGRY